MERPQCVNEAAFRYTWPHGEESFLCTEHAVNFEALVTAVGVPLQVIALDRTVDRETCCERVSEQR